MGQRLMRRPPKYVHGYLDRHGKPRFYFRRPGYKRTPLPGLPWSAEFMTVYQEVLAGQPVPIDSCRRFRMPPLMCCRPTSTTSPRRARAAQGGSASVLAEPIAERCRLEWPAEPSGEKRQVVARRRINNCRKWPSAACDRPRKPHGAV
jgi:hypothetical protein